jgi:hypothetical protein
MIVALLVHLQEQKAGDLLDIVAVANAVVAQHVRVVPDFVDERGRAGHGPVPPVNVGGEERSDRICSDEPKLGRR